MWEIKYNSDTFNSETGIIVLKFAIIEFRW